nr:hypothetical protein [Arthrospira sp. PLM2.Bin9]
MEEKALSPLPKPLSQGERGFEKCDRLVNFSRFGNAIAPGNLLYFWETES